MRNLSDLSDRMVLNQSGRASCFFLPYSPELNPDDFVWNDVKNNGIGRKMICSEADIERAVDLEIQVAAVGIRREYEVSFARKHCLCYLSREK